MQFQINYKYFQCLVLWAICFTTFAQQPDTSFTQTGLASYYHKKFNGRKTTSGEIYSNKKLTAAHLTLPFGTKVKVTNLATHKWVIVKINDRGPHSKKKIIDVSYRAARHLGMLNGNGIVKVLIEVVPMIKTPDDSFRQHEAQ
jgi:rare lipoprotein A